jgi:hypothetical protein
MHVNEKRPCASNLRPKFPLYIKALRAREANTRAEAAEKDYT